MKGFIEIHTHNGKCHLVNIRHIVEVDGSTIYTDDFHPQVTDFPHLDCTESYEDIRDKIEDATP
jgi:hypothetical protein